ncbi:rhodanese-like domain-containing protein [Candidatus Pacearchaeota archaeon]|nr:rhodanese-like domain-containing protein [Candidatus Pacearchaeota archaeon]
MKASLLRLILFGLLAVTLVLAACSGGSATTSINTTTTTTGIPGPPSPEELAAQGFVLPELPRITCDQLKQMIDNGEPLTVVDTRLKIFFNTGHLPQSINMPFQPEDKQTTSLLTLPKDRPIIFYCD